MLLRVLLHQRHVRLTLIVLTLVQLLFQFGNTLLQLRHVGKSLLSLLPDSRRVLKVHHLRQITDGGIVRYIDHTCSRLLHTTKYLQQRRLTRIVLAHQGNTVTVVHHETSVGKQWLDTKFHTQSFNRYHVFTLSSIKLTCKSTTIPSNHKIN